MSRVPDLNDGGGVLRRRAEERVRLREGLVPGTDEPKRLLDLIHELRVHRIELEMQNEELRRAQEALSESHSRYFDLYDLAPVGYLTLDRKGMIREGNLAASRLLGAHRAALVGRPLSQYIDPRDQDLYYRSLRGLREHGEPQSCELRLCSRGLDEPRWIILEASPGPAAEGAGGDWRAVLTDIDARRRAEEALKEQDRRKDRFLAILGHELRNPLAPILNVAEILRRSPALEPLQVQEIVAILDRQAQHLARLVGDLLDVARIRSGTMRIERRHCDLRRAAECALEQVRPLCLERGQELRLALPEAALMVLGDETRLAQAIANLLRNASQFSPAGAPIDLALDGAGALAEVRVRDQGAGIDSALLPRLFEPFVQAEQPPERAAGGLGLGLSLVMGLMKLHGGTALVQSPGPGLGSTFVLRLPRLPTLSAPAPAPVPAVLAPSGPVSATPPSRLVLVVEDNPDVADACAMLLALLGQQVHRVGDGPAALAAAERLAPDLILLDLGLPGMDGFEVARRLRETPAGKAAYLVAVTGYGQEGDLRRTCEAGFDEHIVKPMGQGALLDLLWRYPPRPPGPARSCA